MNNLNTFLFLDDKVKRYSVYSENGIVACYTCIDSDKGMLIK